MSIKDWHIDTTWTLFLDRDGVINERVFGGYITKPEEFRFLPDVETAIAGLTKKFHRLIVVTNQQGVGKGLMSERNVLEIHAYMCDQIHRSGGKIDKCFFAPNLIGDIDDLRKPNSEMAKIAKIEFPEIDYEHAVMIGDTDTDILFGKNVGMYTVRIKTDEPIGVEADLTVKSLYDFLKQINNET